LSSVYSSSSTDTLQFSKRNFFLSILSNFGLGALKVKDTSSFLEGSFFAGSRTPGGIFTVVQTLQEISPHLTAESHFVRYDNLLERGFYPLFFELTRSVVPNAFCEGSPNIGTRATPPFQPTVVWSS